MKKVILLAFALATGQCFAQNVTIDKDGNFVAVKTQTAAHDSTTTKTYTNAKGQVEKVYVTSRGSFYVPKVSKAGNYYRKYLKVEVPEAKK